jgi:hypothetical protein
MKKIPKKRNTFLTILKVLQIILTVIFCDAMVMLAGAGLIYNGDTYGESLIRVGVLLIISGAIMTVGSILLCLKKNVASLICICAGFALCMLMLVKLMNHADSAGWSDNYTMEPVSDMYFRRIMPVIAPFVIGVALGLIQFFSFDAVQARREKKRLKLEKENEPAPPII